MPSLNIPISRDLLLRIRRAAMDRGVTRREFVLEAVQAEVVRHVYGPRSAKRESPVAPGRNCSNGHGEKVPVEAATSAMPSSDPNPETGSAASPITVEPPYHSDTRAVERSGTMSIEDAVRKLFPQRLQAEIERSIRSGGG